MRRLFAALVLAASAAIAQEEPASPATGGAQTRVALVEEPASPATGGAQTRVALVEEPASPATGGARTRVALVDEPTPFWMPPPPPKEKKEQPRKKKPKPPAAEKPVEKAPPPKPQVQKPPPAPQKKPPPTWIEAPPPPAPVVRTPAPTPAPAVVTPLPAPARAPEPTPAPPPVLVTPPPVLATPPPVLATPPPVLATPPPIAAPPISETPAPVIAEQQEPEPESPPSDVRAWSFDLLAGGWAKARSDGSGRAWDLAYGLRASFGLFEDSLEVELQLVRAGGSSGSPFVSTSDIHTLGMARGFWVWGDRFAVLLGGGAGVALSQTQYALVDVVSGNVSSLSATAIKPVIGITAAGRVRVFGGLQARVEVSGLLRDGRLEYMPLFGLGWAL